MISTPFLVTALYMLHKGGIRPFHARPYYNIALLTIINLTSNMVIAKSLMFVDTSYWLETIRGYTASFLGASIYLRLSVTNEEQLKTFSYRYSAVVSFLMIILLFFI
jgi:hypothetical protein